MNYCNPSHYQYIIKIKTLGGKELYGLTNNPNEITYGHLLSFLINKLDYKISTNYDDNSKYESNMVGLETDDYDKPVNFINQMAKVKMIYYREDIYFDITIDFNSKKNQYLQILEKIYEKLNYDKTQNQKEAGFDDIFEENDNLKLYEIIWFSIDGKMFKYFMNDPISKVYQDLDKIVRKRTPLERKYILKILNQNSKHISNNETTLFELNYFLKIYNHQTLKYNVENIPIKSDGMQLFVKVLDGRTIICKVHPFDTIEHLKLLIEDKEGISVENLRLIWGGKQLENDKTFSDYGIGEERTIHIVAKMCGGMFKEVSGRNGDYQPLKSIYFSLDD